MFKIINYPLEIDGRVVWLYSEEGLVDLVEEYMGRDSAELLRNLLDSIPDEEMLGKLRDAGRLIDKVIETLTD